MLRISVKARETSKTLAVAYNAYLDASRTKEYNGVIVWGGMLLRAQEALGIELVQAQRLSDNIAYARRREAEANRFAA